MVLKVMWRPGKQGRKKVIWYLLNDHDHKGIPRERKPVVLRGNPGLLHALLMHSQGVQSHVCFVLSFNEPFDELISRGAIAGILRDLRRILISGHDEYAVAYTVIVHQTPVKAWTGTATELNVVVAANDLVTSRVSYPFLWRQDQQLWTAFQDYCNARWSLTSPRSRPRQLICHRRNLPHALRAEIDDLRARVKRGCAEGTIQSDDDVELEFHEAGVQVLEKTIGQTPSWLVKLSSGAVTRLRGAAFTPGQLSQRGPLLSGQVTPRHVGKLYRKFLKGLSRKTRREIRFSRPRQKFPGDFGLHFARATRKANELIANLFALHEQRDHIRHNSMANETRNAFERARSAVRRICQHFRKLPGALRKISELDQRIGVIGSAIRSTDRSERSPERIARGAGASSERAIGPGGSFVCARSESTGTARERLDALRFGPFDRDPTIIATNSVQFAGARRPDQSTGGKSGAADERSREHDRSLPDPGTVRDALSKIRQMGLAAADQRLKQVSAPINLTVR